MFKIFKRKPFVYKNLDAVIVEQQLSIMKLAFKIRANPFSLKDKLYGKKSISLREACCIARVLKTDVDYLFQELAAE